MSNLSNAISFQTKFIAGFTILLIVIVLSEIIFLQRYDDLQEINFTSYNHPTTVRIADLEVILGIGQIEEVIRDVVSAGSIEKIDDFVHKVAIIRAEIALNMHTIEDRFLGSKMLVLAANAALAELNDAYNEELRLVRSGQIAESRLYHYNRVHPLHKTFSDRMNEIYSFARDKAKLLLKNANDAAYEVHQEMVVRMAVIILFVVLILVLINCSVIGPLRILRDKMMALAAGDLTVDIPYCSFNTELGRMAGAVEVFKDAAQLLTDQRWIKAEVGALSIALQTTETSDDFAGLVLGRFVTWPGAELGLFYIRGEDDGRFRLSGSLGCGSLSPDDKSFLLGEGLPGRCAASGEVVIVKDLPKGYLTIGSGLGEAPPNMLAIIPIKSRCKIMAVIEIGGFGGLDKLDSVSIRDLIDQVVPVIALNLEILQRKLVARRLLDDTRQQAIKLAESENLLQIQTNELQAINDEILTQNEELNNTACELRVREEEMHCQQDQLKCANHELSEKAQSLSEQTVELTVARNEAEQRSVELSLASRYKTEFLANMSHELRTPLNSLLILAKSLADNEENNLTVDQVESAEIVHDSGLHLLRLINDLLDIARIESGKMQVLLHDVSPQSISDIVERRFRGMALAKKLSLKVIITPNLPEFITTDGEKFEQILINLVGNAIKFTAAGGSVTMSFGCPRQSGEVDTGSPVNALAVSVTDTGIGISDNQIDHIFQPFEQADGSSSRRYGGTGLGLSIARKLARLLGGDIKVHSQEGHGSTFTLMLPVGPSSSSAKQAELTFAQTMAPGSDVVVLAAPARTPTVNSLSLPFIPDDRNSLAIGDPVMLVADDDPHFARIVSRLIREKGFKCLVAGDGESTVELAMRFQPVGIMLDIGLPVLDGWGVLERLRMAPETRAIPIHIISAGDNSERAEGLGVIGFLAKPVTVSQVNSALERIINIIGTCPQRLIIADADSTARASIIQVVKKIGMEIIEVSDSDAILNCLRSGRVDCLVVDVDIPGGCIALLEAVGCDATLNQPPVIVMAGRELKDNETQALRGYTDSIIVKSNRSEERLLDEVRLFLHSIGTGTLPAPEVTPAGKASRHLDGRTVLVVDDDMRNSSALSKVLRKRGLRVLLARDGQHALTQLRANLDVDFVLMDIMMPVMDGYEAMREIRKEPRFSRLPIIALTARAMPNEPNLCLEAGANDYLSKPVDIDVLVAKMSKLASL